jgi:hypothetical protein
VDRHRGIDECVVGEELKVVGCQDKGGSRVGFNDPIFSRSAEGRALKLAVQCRAVESQVAEAAGKLETVKTEVKDFESRVAILTEVRYVHLSC